MVRDSDINNVAAPSDTCAPLARNANLAALLLSVTIAGCAWVWASQGLLPMGLGDTNAKSSPPQDLLDLGSKPLGALLGTNTLSELSKGYVIFGESCVPCAEAPMVEYLSLCKDRGIVPVIISPARAAEDFQMKFPKTTIVINDGAANLGCSKFCPRVAQLDSSGKVIWKQDQPTGREIYARFTK